ncbi:MAG: hypothetical protein A2268_05835 [Candidatus Raymondbacteria bacterium RifOxyA12_full_50_37]|uniref:DUF2380 domain-containing protein n=1 Tax=Candidatus Raymondbacteria bacterium RIFOXYD12_FULL_49_13 TaxID=1817890 RepID=A0A1F7FG36_UNCRA|nr:MAG: hypothetical protein A2268_05835 [Candidatus Raymondbacteria bacterium RifOxyA12_full_50_37]OGJ94262.1 MAG: hypothetical protein A2248_14765 [Candidatus Raymondbacteria bacterium RIFOXYA2_FULL_49_16]OGJ96375.1 MAG: hypothetical protein A2487_00365 [Candidatus Raymondbacteria bacterium RifOxyC12_full_50_8]OGJ99092.1 MAG: hypothetical protein A2453_11175 [Candidatus Raymondbacteria bacterium RIFOXYC2_FULL_50_21]OGK01190.1 MAG: hypothetical protein A2350_01655 [Candidatus Raymondbacteria b
MNNHIAFFSIVFILAWSIVQGQEAQPAQQQPLKVRSIAVLDLEGSGVEPGETKTLSDALRAKILDRNVYTVMERGKVDIILQEQGFQRSGACDEDACVVEMGQLLGVDAMVVGSIGKVGQTYSVAVRMFAVQSGKIVQSASRYYKGEIDGLLTEVIDGIAEQICTAATAPSSQAKSPESEKKGSGKKAEVKQSNTVLYVGIAALVIGGGVGAYFFMKDSDEPTTEEPAKRPAFPSPPASLQFITGRGE